MLLFLLFAVVQDVGPAPSTPFDRVIPLEIDAGDELLAGHGRAERVEYVADFAGTLHLWTRAVGGLDPFLRIESPPGEFVSEDDDSGGCATPYLCLAVEPGRELVVHVAAGRADEQGALELCALASPETEATSSASEEAGRAIAEVRRLREAGEIDLARAMASEALEALLSTPDAGASELASERAWALGHEAYYLALPEQAAAAWGRAHQQRSRTRPPCHGDLLSTCQSFAVVIKALGDLAGARKLQEQVVETRLRSLPSDHIDVQTARGNLAMTLRSLGDLRAAREVEEGILAVFSRTLPDDHPYLQKARGNLAATLYLLGDLQAARGLQEKALEVLSRTTPADSTDLQALRGNLALTLGSLGEWQAALELQETVLGVLSRTVPDHHPLLQTARQGLAVTCTALGDPQRALALEEQVIDALSRTVPDDHPDLLRAQQGLALILESLGDLEGARAVQEEVLAVFSRTLPDEHRDLQMVRANLARTYLELTLCLPRAERAGAEVRAPELEKAMSLLRDHSRAQVAAARVVRLCASSREAEERCAGLTEFLDFTLTAALGYGDLGPLRELEPEAFAYSEATRSGGVTAGSLARLAATSPRHAQLRERLKAASADLARLARSGPSSEEIRRASSERDDAQRALVDLGRELAGGEAICVELDAERLARGLAPGTAAVSFRRFRRFGTPAPAASDGSGAVAPVLSSVESLCAFVVRPRAGAAPAAAQAELALLDLGPLEPVERAIGAWRAALGVGEGRGIAVTPRPQAADIDARGAALRELVFDPLLPALGDARRLVLVLDDVLHLVSFDALPAAGLGDRGAADEGLGGDRAASELLGERYGLEVRSTLGELFDRPRPRSSSNLLVALGAAAFDAEPLGLADEELPPAVGRESVEPPALHSRATTQESGFAPLAHSGEEARALCALHAVAFGSAGSVQLLEQARASRSALETLAPLARFLHLATHGWYASESIPSWSELEPIDSWSGLGLRRSGAEQIKGMSPMLLCGLALAGANWGEDAARRAPGLITAEEVAALDLSQCELAVLSACDTNAGERRAGQGVASLQKALQIAGARSVITSLWKVPDEATKELMLDFYRRLWVERKPVHRALWEAKLCLRAKADETGAPLYSTRDWAAWVLTGEPE